MAENLRVAVRLRPFNERETTRNAKLIIEMSNNTTVITDPGGKFEEKKFTFDFSYWSHDGYREREDGYLEPTDSKYADQDKVFQDLGQGVLENAWKGFNCSLFAYGQTGSGKSYSMVGYNQNKGIIPITCEELFKGIDAKKETDDSEREAEYQVLMRRRGREPMAREPDVAFLMTVSGSQINISWDFLARLLRRAGLRPVDALSTGPQWCPRQTVSVSMLEIYNETVKDLLNLSSFKKGGLRVREHPQKGFYVEQLQVSPVSDYADIEARIAEGTRNRTLASTNMNATSSRAHTVVAINFAQKAKNDAGESMTKTSIINLVDLAGSERADSTGATGERLKEGSMINRSLLCLGNCIKALADVQDGKNVNVPFRDSVLTRLLKNALGGNSKTIMIAALSPADINYDETLSTLRFADRAKAIKTKAVVNESPTDKLIREMKDEIKRLQDLLKNQGPDGVPVVVQGISPEEVEEMRRAQEEELLRNQEEIDQMKLTWQQRLEDQSQESQKMLDAERAKQEARKTTPHLWNLNEDPMLTGMIVHLTPPGVTTIGSSEPAVIVLKGLSVKKEHAAIDNDSNSAIYLTPSGGDNKLLINGKVATERTELRHNDRIMFGSNHLYVFHHPQDAARQEKEGKFVAKVSFNSAQEEIAQNKGFDMNKAGKSTEDMLLQEDLIQIMPMVNEANAMSEELDKKMLYEIALISPQARGLKDGRTEISIKAKKLVNGNEFLWERNNFIDRKYTMQEIYQMFVEDDDEWDKKHQGEYPFSDNDDSDVMIGCCYFYPQTLAYLLDMEDNLTIRNYRGDETGLMSISAAPYSQDGKEIVDECLEDPEELIGKNIQFMIDIKKILAIPKKYLKVWCRYKFLLHEDWSTSTQVDASINAQLDCKEFFKAFPVSKQLIEELENTAIVIQVWGRQKVEVGDPSRAKLSTNELLALEDAVTTYQPSKKGAPSKGGQESKMLRKQESMINNLHLTVDNVKKAQQEAEGAKMKLVKENEAYKNKMKSMERKLELLSAMVNEAKQKGDLHVPVARMDHILRTGEDLSAQALKKLNKELKTKEPVNVAPPSKPTPPPPYQSTPTFPPRNGNNELVPRHDVKSFKSNSSSSSSSSSSPPPSSRKKVKQAKSSVCALL